MGPDERDAYATQRMTSAVYNLGLFLLIGFACWFTASAWPCLMIVATADGIYSRMKNTSAAAARDTTRNAATTAAPWPYTAAPWSYTAAPWPYPDPDISTDRGGDTHRPGN